MALEVQLEVTNPAKIVSPVAVNAAVETAKATVSGAVTADQIADGAVGAGKIADGAVGTGKIADGAVTAAKIAAGLVGVRVAGAAMGAATGVQQLGVSFGGVSGLAVAVQMNAGDRALLIASVTVSGGDVGLRLTRNGAAVMEPAAFYGYQKKVMSASAGTSSGFSLHTVPLVALDGPVGASGSYTYAVQALGLNGEWINRSKNDNSASASHMRSVSTLIVVRLGPEAAG